MLRAAQLSQQPRDLERPAAHAIAGTTLQTVFSSEGKGGTRKANAKKNSNHSAILSVICLGLF